MTLTLNILFMNQSDWLTKNDKLLIRELSCVWLKRCVYVRLKSSNPQNSAFLLKGYIFCLLLGLIFAIWKSCVYASARSSLQKRRRWSENTDKQVSWRLPISMRCLCSVMKSQLFCLRLWLLIECTYSTAVVLIAKHYCDLLLPSGISLLKHVLLVFTN